LQKAELKIADALGYAGNQKPRFERKPSRGAPQPKFFCGFQSGLQHSCQYEEETTDNAWNIVKARKLDTGIDSIWVGCRFRFDFEAESDFLTSVSLLFLRFRKSFCPLIRAEWDYREPIAIKKDTFVHSQPHWHILANLQQERFQNDSTEDMIDFLDMAPALADGRNRLHLSMSTNWTEPDGIEHVKKNITEEGLVNWIDQTVRYSIDQVRYVIGLVPPSDDEKETLKDFMVAP